MTWHWQIFKKVKRKKKTFSPLYLAAFCIGEYVCISWISHDQKGILIWKKVKYTHISSGEQGTVGLRHVHVVVVILKLWIKTKKSTLSLLVSIISRETQALSTFIMDTCHSNRLSHLALNVYILRVNPFLYVHPATLPLLWHDERHVRGPGQFKPG